MNVLNLARQLNATEILSVKKEIFARCNSQQFDYLLVLDFEATCWNKKDGSKCSPEIIEFPCVLYDVRKNQILSQFQEYVMPIENQKLSAFCTELTGIQQTQVDKGIPLKTCIMLFKTWLKEQGLKYNITVRTTFATWSDWDLGVCLKNECRRKRITVPDMFNTWIDIRAIYMKHYLRRPKGLYGALLEVGLEFEGRMHCGLDDAKNTAKLIGRMVNDGVLLQTTSGLS